MKNLAIVLLLTFATSFSVSASTLSSTNLASVEQSTIQKPKKKKRGYNYKAHKARNKKMQRRSNKKYRSAGGDLTQVNCRRK